MRLFTRPQLKVGSAIFTNLFVVWLAAMLLAKDFFTLTVNLLLAIVSLLIAIKAEKMLEKYEF